jgi:hypothetical protein
MDLIPQFTICTDWLDCNKPNKIDVFGQYNEIAEIKILEMYIPNIIVRIIDCTLF